MLKISVTILTKNSAKSLERTLNSLREFEEVLVYDTGSVDETRQIAKRYSNFSLHEGPFEGFGATHNTASTLASHEWILSIDSDEWLSESLISEISGLELDSHLLYQVKRKNFFQGRWIWSAGWGSDWQKRLYHRKATSFDSALVHESIQSKDLKILRLKNPLNHEPYRSLEDFLAKMQHYSALFAQQSQKGSSPFKAVSHGLFAFLKSYFLKGGVFQGYEGWIISIYNAHCAFYKYLKLYEKQRLLSKPFQ